MAMVDALMMAYTVEMISIEKVVASVKRFSTFSASKELPYDLEDAMVFWVNKVSATVRLVLMCRAEAQARAGASGADVPHPEMPAVVRTKDRPALLLSGAGCGGAGGTEHSIPLVRSASVFMVQMNTCLVFLSTFLL